jgi:hypothetical protein
LDPLLGLYREKKDQEKGNEIKKHTIGGDIAEGGRKAGDNYDTNQKAWASSDIFPSTILTKGPKFQLSYTGRHRRTKLFFSKK